MPTCDTLGLQENSKNRVHNSGKKEVENVLSHAQSSRSQKGFWFVLKLSLVSSPHSFLHQFLNFHSNTPPRSANLLLCNTDYRFFGGGVGAGRKGSNRKILENKYILNVFPEETLKVDEGDGSAVFLGELTFLQKK